MHQGEHSEDFTGCLNMPKPITGLAYTVTGISYAATTNPKTQTRTNKQKIEDRGFKN